METIDGIVVKVKDTDANPLDADIEIRVGDDEVECEDLCVGTRVSAPGLSGRSYYIEITGIDDETETVHFAVHPGSSLMVFDRR